MRVLVVEDEPRLAGLVRQSLEESGFSVDEALNVDYDAVIPALMLPRLDGLTSTGGPAACGLAIDIGGWRSPWRHVKFPPGISF